VVTTLYLGVTSLIWVTARNSLKLAFLDLRPWVTTGAFGKEGVALTVNAGAKTFFTTEMKNVGRTPAFITVAGTHTNVYRSLSITVPQIETGGCPVLAPGDDRELPIIVPAIEKEHLPHIGSTLHLVTFVIIRYRDSQGRAHETISAHELVQLPGTDTFRWQDLSGHGVMS
jgi:hypothetical protein